MQFIIFCAILTLVSSQQRFGNRRRGPLLTKAPDFNGDPNLIQNVSKIPISTFASAKSVASASSSASASAGVNLGGGLIFPGNGLPISPGFNGNNNIGRFVPQLVLSQGVHADFNGRTQAEAENLIEEEWRTFQLQFQKVYASPEDALRRKEIFIENRKKVTRHNQDYAFGRTTFFLKLNPLADLLTHEFNSLMNGFGKSRRGEDTSTTTGSTFLSPAHIGGLPVTIDWRQEGAVTSVKSQQQCAGCFAFSAAAAIEGHHFRKTGRLVDLSPQHLIDCTNNDDYNNLGCDGGYVDDCFVYIKNNPGINIDPAYPFEAQTGQCRFDGGNIGANVTGFVVIPENDEYALAQAVAIQGPVSVAIDAFHDTFQLYSEGIYFDPNCKNNAASVNHAVLVVGYGEEPDGRRYWLVKNSYGPQWGVGGYIKMARDAGNHCGIASQAYYPLV